VAVRQALRGVRAGDVPLSPLRALRGAVAVVIGPADSAPVRARVLTAECSRRGHGRTRVARLGGVFAAECCDRAKFRSLTKEGGAVNPLTKYRAKAPESRPSPRPGEQYEAALYAALVRDWFYDMGEPQALDHVQHNPSACFLRQYPWGAYLSPPRRFSSDIGFPFSRLLVEIDGGAHAAGKAKQRSDTERRGLAGAAGWRVVALTPEQVHDGTAIELVRAALAAGRATT
jgi:hypothetical protein